MADGKKITARRCKKRRSGQTNSIFSERAVFAPTTMLAAENQGNYNFTFLGYDKQNGRECAIINGVPSNPDTTRGFYGKAWIDLEDHSVLKVQADPGSINGYHLLKKFAESLDTRLQLSLEMNFAHLHGGIRFPTRVSMLEKYKGGRTISRFKGPNGWERNRTEFIYNDYRFFSVNTDVVINH